MELDKSKLKGKISFKKKPKQAWDFVILPKCLNNFKKINKIQSHFEFSTKYLKKLKEFEEVH